MTDKKPKRSTVLWRIILLVVLLIAAVIVLVIIFNKQASYNVNTFAECKNAGGVILETYPEQCKINDLTFTNPEQSGDVSREYVGLTEEDALNKALDKSKAARVVKRDGQDLPITMDFSPGRLNFYVQDDKVYMVQVEGETSN